MKRLALLFVSTACVLAGLLLPASAAHAATCTGTNHCYGRVGWDVSGSGGFDGAEITVRSNCMTVPDSADNFATNELWVAQSRSGNWVEAGITRGAEAAGGQTTGVEYYWADYRGQNQNPYNEHYDGQYPSYGTYSDVQIVWRTGTEWDVKSGPSLISTSTNNYSPPSTLVLAGDEYTEDSVVTYGSVSDLAYFTQTGSKVNGWSSTRSGHAVDFSTGSGGSGWASQYTWARVWSGAGAGGC